MSPQHNKHVIFSSHSSHRGNLCLAAPSRSVISVSCLHLPLATSKGEMLGAPPAEKSACVHALCAESLQSPPTLCDPVDCSPPGSSVHGIFQARMLEWVVTYFSRGSSPPRGEPAPPASSALQADSLLLSHRGSPLKSNPIQFKFPQSAARLKQSSPQESPHTRSRKCALRSFQKLETWCHMGGYEVAQAKAWLTLKAGI